MMSHAILTVEEMTRADELAIRSGVSGETLMEAAGAAVAAEVMRLSPPCPVTVLCGPGNNGGDGFVAARHLADCGYAVRLALAGDVARLKGDAATMQARWSGPILAPDMDVLDGAHVVVDALFGAGLSRPLDGAVAALIEEVTRRSLKVVAVDVPSGVDGNSGRVLGVAAQALSTVTFFRRKPAHLLLPGRLICGEVVLAQIGIPDAVLATILPQTALNDPSLWLSHFPWPRADGHKYSRGHALVVGGETMTGAAMLAARAARRVGAGLVTVAAPTPSLNVYRCGDPGNIVQSLDDFPALLADPRRNAVLLGPGGGSNEAMRRLSALALGAGKACVLDADALTAFAGQPKRLFDDLSLRALLTPHDGEFRRLFPHMSGSRLERARDAARTTGAIILLKGADTVIAHPDGRALINANAPPALATAGSGDVLAGMAVGLMAAGMVTFEAAAAAVWLHGRAASAFGPGLIAEDIAEQLPKVLSSLKSGRQ